MLTRELMGLALLGISWMTALMVALDALIDARAMLSLLRRPTVKGTAKSDELASHEVEQRIKELDSESPGLVFFDRKHTSVVKGGVVTLDGGAEVTVTGAVGAEVWFPEETRLSTAACTTTSQFDAVKKSAQGPGGGLRTLRTAVTAGQPVWLMGERTGERFVATVVSAMDPHQFARGRVMGISGLLALNAAWVVAGTALAFWPPVFGVISIGGAVLLIAHFLGMTALAMAVREKSRHPSVAFVRGTWKRDEVRESAPVSDGSVVA